MPGMLVCLGAHVLRPSEAAEDSQRPASQSSHSIPGVSASHSLDPSHNLKIAWCLQSPHFPSQITSLFPLLY